MAVRMTESMDGVLRDIRHSIRGLRRSPGFALAVLLTLALGIGGNTAIFSIVDQVLLRPLPFPDGDRIVRIYESRLDRPATSVRRCVRAGHGDSRKDAPLGHRRLRIPLAFGQRG